MPLCHPEAHSAPLFPRSLKIMARTRLSPPFLITWISSWRLSPTLMALPSPTARYRESRSGCWAESPGCLHPPRSASRDDRQELSSCALCLGGWRNILTNNRVPGTPPPQTLHNQNCLQTLPESVGASMSQHRPFLPFCSVTTAASDARPLCVLRTACGARLDRPRPAPCVLEWTLTGTGMPALGVRRS